MKKYFLLSVVLFILTLQAGANCEDAVRYGLLVTVLQDPVTLESRSEIDKLIKVSEENHIDTIFIQVYRANQSYFPSKVGDSAPYRACVKNVGKDPLALLITKAHLSGIKVYAWMNTMSLGANENAVILKKYGQGILTGSPSKKISVADYKTDEQYFMEPGDLRVRRELVNMTEEIVSTYTGLDGLLFDYIRYPDKDPPYGYTNMNIARFKKSHRGQYANEDNSAWRDWKRLQVTETLEALVNKARATRHDISISATACAPYARAYHEAFQDWPAWLKSGLVDYVTIMSYPPDLKSMKKYVEETKEEVPDLKRVNIAVPAYKLVDSVDIFEEQLKFCRGYKPNMCILFDYESLLKNKAFTKALAGANK